MTSDETREFHLGDLLSITDGRLLSPTHVTGVGLLLSYMCGEPVMTHQLSLAAGAMEPQLLDQHEWLRGFGPPTGVDVPDLIAWLDWAVKEHGEFHSVRPAPEAWGSHDPIEDWVNQGGDPSKVIAVELPPAVD
jgi:hypothetical protein